MIFGLKHFREIIGEGLRLTLKRISFYTESQESVEILPSEIVKKTADEMPSLVSGVKTLTAGRTEAIGRPQSSPMNPSNPSADQKPMTHWVYSSMITFLLGWLFFCGSRPSSVAISRTTEIRKKVIASNCDLHSGDWDFSPYQTRYPGHWLAAKYSISLCSSWRFIEVEEAMTPSMIATQKRRGFS